MYSPTMFKNDDDHETSEKTASESKEEVSLPTYAQMSAQLQENPDEFLSQLVPADIFAALRDNNLYESLEINPEELISMADSKEHMTDDDLGAHIKSLLIQVKVTKKQKDYYLCALPGDRQLDKEKLAEHLNVGKNKISIARQEVAEVVTGFQRGAIGPMGLPASIPVIYDDSFATKELLYMTPGHQRLTLRIAPGLLFNIAPGDQVSLSSEPTAEEENACGLSPTRR